MIFSNDYVGYLARKTVSGLLNAKVIQSTKPQLLSERVAAGLVDELKVEDRINEEARLILETIQEDMRRTGASYPEMFKKIKMKLVNQYKAVL